MFKRLGLVLLGIFLATSVALAGTDNKVIIDAAELKPATGLTATSDTVYLQDYRGRAFFVNYDETDTGSVISGVVTYEVSYDNSNWLSARFFDYAGDTTSQTSETLSTDSWYYLWPDPNLTVPFGRIKVACTNCKATDDTTVSVYIVGNK